MKSNTDTTGKEQLGKFSVSVLLSNKIVTALIYWGLTRC